LESDPELKNKASAGMSDILQHRWGTILQLGLVGWPPYWRRVSIFEEVCHSETKLANLARWKKDLRMSPG